MIHVVQREILRLGGIAVTVGAGVAWITRRGAADDWVLEAGQRMALRGRGWLVQNLRSDGELRLNLEPIARPALPD